MLYFQKDGGGCGRERLLYIWGPCRSCPDGWCLLRVGFMGSVSTVVRELPMGEG